MAMNPGTMMMLASLAMSAVGAFTGKKGEQKSSYNHSQQSGFKDIINMIGQMRSGEGGNPDVTQNHSYQTGQNYLNDMFNDPDFFKNFEAPLQRQFQEQTVPDLANRFASMGSGGALGSTGFRNQLGREGSNLSTNIAAQRGQMQQGAIPQLSAYAQQPIGNMMNLYQQLLGQPINNQYQPPSQGGFGALAGPLASGAASYWGGQGGQQNQNFPGQAPSTGVNYGSNSLGGGMSNQVYKGY